MTEANVSESQPEVVTTPAVTEVQQPATTPEPKPNTTANGERLDRQTRNWRALERDRDYWREIAMRTQAAQPAPAPETGKTLADFNYDEAQYQAHLFQKAEARAVEAAEKRLKEQAERENQSRLASTFKSRESAFAKSNPDYYEVAHDDSIPISKAMAEAIAESEEGPAIAYHLGKNPDIAASIAELSPLAAARELGRIEARLIAEREKAKAPVVTQAPPPPPKIEGSNPDVEKDPSKMSDAEYDKWRRRQIAQRR